MGQGRMSRSSFPRAAVDIRNSALPSAAKSKEGLYTVFHHYQSRVFVCVSNNRADAVDRLLIFDVLKATTAGLWQNILPHMVALFISDSANISILKPHIA